MNSMMRLRGFLLSALFVLATLPIPTVAQSPVSVALKVNQAVITQYELDQRVRLLGVINTSGDLQKLARKQLIDDSLKRSAAESLKISVDQATLEQAMNEFAASGNLTLEPFLSLLGKAGIDRRSFEDFVSASLVWRTVIRSKFRSKVKITEAEVDRAYQARLEGSTMRVLLSEIIMPISKDNSAQMTAQAKLIAKITSIKAFSKAAKKYSVAQSRDIGGRIDWTEVRKLPPALQARIVSMTPGQVTEPIPLDGGVALFQLRDIEETAYRAPPIAVVDYMTYRVYGSDADTARRMAHSIEPLMDSCDDMYGIAKGQPEDRLQRHSKAPADIPTTLALALERLDSGETTVKAQANKDGSVTLIMVCGRTAETLEDVLRQDVMLGLQTQRLGSYAEQYMQQLRNSAYITKQ
jgi:peptidyl-prolyl cis-trans isomerase SurA